MKQEENSLAQFESFLSEAAGIPRDKMDAGEFKKFIVEFHNLKRTSDEFDRKRDRLQEKDFAFVTDEHRLMAELPE